MQVLVSGAYLGKLRKQLKDARSALKEIEFATATGAARANRLSTIEICYAVARCALAATDGEEQREKAKERVRENLRK